MRCCLGATRQRTTSSTPSTTCSCGASKPSRSPTSRTAFRDAISGVLGPFLDVFRLFCWGFSRFLEAFRGVSEERTPSASPAKRRAGPRITRLQALEDLGPLLITDVRGRKLFSCSLKGFSKPFVRKKAPIWTC